MNKKIALDCERMKYPFTGLYYFCKELGKAFLKQSVVAENLDFTFYTPERERGVFGVNEKYITQKSIHKVLPKNTSAFDIWHCTYQGSRYLPSKKSGTKVLTTVHDLNFLHLDKNGSKKKKYLQKLQALVDRSDAIVTISNFVKAEVLEHLNVDAKKIKVIYNGCNTPPPLSLERLEKINDKPFFFSIGTITEKKNFHVLPAMLLNNDHDLVIAGINQSQVYYDRIINEARKLGVEHRVFLTGAVTEENKFWLYKHCSAFCFPSIAEGFGLPVIEAMQFGTPVILSKATSLPEIGGPNALYFDAFDTDAVNKTAIDFLNNPLTDDDKDLLIKWTAQFNWDVAATQYCDLYAAL